MIFSNFYNADIDIQQIITEEAQMGTLERYLQELPEKALRIGVRVAMAAIFFLIGMQVIKLIRKVIKKSFQFRNADLGVIQFMDSFIKYALTIMLIFFIAGQCGLDATGIVALLGSAGVAIGLAVQGSLSNFAGGVLILLLKPFKVGDFIKEDAHGNEGVVDEIQLFYTKLHTLDNKIVVLPNGELANNSITNATNQDARMVIMKVSISYDDDIKTAKAILVNCMEKDERVLKDRDHFVVVSDLGAHGVDLECRLWVATADYWAVKWSLLEAFKYALDESGIVIPYNQLDVYMKEKKDV